jgi:hypothetical protein
MRNNIIFKSATIGFIIGIIVCIFGGWFNIVTLSLFGDDIFMHSMVIPFLPIVLVILTYVIYGAVIGFLIKNIKLIKNVSIKKNGKRILLLFFWLFHFFFISGYFQAVKA